MRHYPFPAPFSNFRSAIARLLYPQNNKHRINAHLHCSKKRLNCSEVRRRQREITTCIMHITTTRAKSLYKYSSSRCATMKPTVTRLP